MGLATACKRHYVNLAGSRSRVGQERDSEQFFLSLQLHWEDAIYCFSFSQKFAGRTNIITSPGFGEAVALPHEFGVTMPCWMTSCVEKLVMASHE